MGKRLEPPRVTLANITVQEVKVLESIFQIDLRVYNTNEASLNIKGIDCDLELNGRRFATGVSKAETEIAAYDTGLIRMTVYSSLLDVMSGLKRLSDTDKIEYKITGRLRLGHEAVFSVIPFISSGELALEKFGGFR